MNNRTCVDRATYAIILANQFAYYKRTEQFEDIAMRKAKQSVAACFVLDATLDDFAFQKDLDDERNSDWTR